MKTVGAVEAADSVGATDAEAVCHSLSVEGVEVDSVEVEVVDPVNAADTVEAAEYRV